jgi:hypothetical protein
VVVQRGLLEAAHRSGADIRWPRPAPPARTALRRDARQQPLHGAPQLDRIGHIPLGKGAHRVPPVGQRLQQPFLLQPHERGTDRRARNPKLFNQGQLGNPRTAWQFTGQDHLAQPHDHVGSFLRPQYLLEAREKKATGQITAEQLRAVEDKAITEIVKFQEDVGLQSITDGEFRRTYFHIDFLEQLGGVKTDIPVTVRKPDGTEELAPPVIRVIDKVRHAKDIQRADFEYLKSQVAAGRTPKVTIPSPTMLHFRGGRAGISKEAYPELDPAFYDDVAAPTATSCAAWPPPAAPTCRWTTPTWPTCATKRCARPRASAVTTPTSCRTATPSSSTRWWRRSRPA